MTPLLPSSHRPRTNQMVRPRRRQTLSVLALIGALVGFALAASTMSAHAADGGLTVTDQWMRLVIPSRPAAGYFTLSNGTGKALALVGAKSPACGMLMLHQSVHQGGQDRMTMMKSVPVPAHGTVKFAPGGYHLMCTSPSKDVTPGRSVPVTLLFEDGSSITASFPVRGATGK